MPSKGSRKSPLGKAIAMELTVKSLLDRSSIMSSPNFTTSGRRPSVYPASVLSEVTSHVLLLLGVLTHIVPKRAPCVNESGNRPTTWSGDRLVAMSTSAPGTDAKASRTHPPTIQVPPSEDSLFSTWRSSSSSPASRFEAPSMALDGPSSFDRAVQTVLNGKPSLGSCEGATDTGRGFEASRTGHPEESDPTREDDHEVERIHEATFGRRSHGNDP